MRAAIAVCALLGLALASACCLPGGPPANVRHLLTDCGLALELPAHFGQPVHAGGCQYQWTTDEGLTTLEIAAALPNDPGLATQSDLLMPGQSVDYARETTFGGLPGRERRTQEQLGAQIRCVWTGFLAGPQGNLNIKLIAVQPMSPDEFGEAFWQNLRTRLIQPLP